jgi:hypothetical protein
VEVKSSDFLTFRVLGIRQRKHNREGTPRLWDAFDVDPAPVLGDNPGGNRQPQPCSFRLGRVKGCKDLGQRLRPDA